jgi:hypothetical protein
MDSTLVSRTTDFMRSVSRERVIARNSTRSIRMDLCVSEEALSLGVRKTRRDQPGDAARIDYPLRGHPFVSLAAALPAHVVMLYFTEPAAGDG